MLNKAEEKKPEQQNNKVKEAINTLKFFDHRVRQTLKERKTKDEIIS